MSRTRSALLLATVLLCSCTLEPDYQRPDFAASAQWDDAPGYVAPEHGEAAIKLGWKEFFRSPELQQVIATALDNNKDLRIAALNIQAARATYRIDRAPLFPNIDVGGGGTIRQSSDRSSTTGRAAKTELYDATVGLSSYEIDLFGKLRSEKNAAVNEWLAATQARDAVRNALIAETANAYLQLAADRKLLALTDKTLAAQEKTHDLLTKSREKGVATDIDVARAATAMETAKVKQQVYRRAIAQDRNALVVLMGVKGDQATIPDLDIDTVDVYETLDPGLPSDVLLMRPDIKQAEYDLLARNADIGAARAAFFPQITLTGDYGFASTALSSLFASGASGAWSFIPQITLPIFAGGRNKASLDLAHIEKDKAVIEYEKAIQQAFREVDDELAARGTLTDQLKAQDRLVAATQTVYDKSNARYKAGIDDFLSVLDAQRELYAAQENQILIRQQRLSNLVTLYKVLGGGKDGSAL